MEDRKMCEEKERQLKIELLGNLQPEVLSKRCEELHEEGEKKRSSM